MKKLAGGGGKGEGLCGLGLAIVEAERSSSVLLFNGYSLKYHILSLISIIGHQNCHIINTIFIFPLIFSITVLFEFISLGGLL